MSVLLGLVHRYVAVIESIFFGLWIKKYSYIDGRCQAGEEMYIYLYPFKSLARTVFDSVCRLSAVASWDKVAQQM